MLLMSVLLTLPLCAQITHTANGNVDENANKILTKASNKFESTSAVSFTVTMINKDSNKKETGRQKADVLYSKGKYRVTAPDQVLYSDGTGVWHWNKQTKEVTVNKMASAEDDLMNPAKLLANYKKNFKAKYIRQEDDGTAVVDLTPFKSKSYYKIRLLINANSGMLKRMEIHNYDSSCGIYEISAVNTGAKCSASDFVFDAASNKGVEVIDMR